MLDRIDHLVLTVSDPERTVDFYERVLGMSTVSFGEGRLALRFGDSKINLHRSGHELDPAASRPTPGSADLCFVVARPLDEVAAHLSDCEVEIVEGPVQRTGALGPTTSIYIRDPDGNLIELSRYGAD